MAYYLSERYEKKNTPQETAINIKSSDLDLLQYLGHLASPLIEVITDVIFYIRSDGIISYISPAVSRFDYQPEELIGRDFKQIIYADDLPALEAAFKLVLRGKPVSLQHRHLDRNGGVHPVRVHLQPVLVQGHVVGACGVVNEASLSYHFEKILQRRAAQLSVLNTIGAQLLSNLELDKVLRSSVSLLQKSFGYFHVAVFMVDEQRKVAVQSAIAGSVKDIFPEPYTIKFNQGMIGEVCLHHQILLANNVIHEPHYVNFFPDRLPTRSELSLPIMLGSELVGVLDIQSPTLNAFDEQDVRTLEAVTHQIAIAIKNARLYEVAQLRISERERAEKFMRLQRDLLAELTASRNLDRSLNLILRTLIRIDGITGGCIYRINENTGDSVLAAHIGMPDVILEADRIVLPVNYQSNLIAQLVVITLNKTTFPEESRTTLESISSLVGAVIARLEAEQSLAASESKHRALIDAIPDLMFLLDKNGVFIDFKPGPNGNFLVPPQYFLGKSLDQVLPEPDAAQTAHHLKQAFETGLPQLFEYELKMPLVSESKLFEARIVRASSNLAVILAKDITELKRTEIHRNHALKLEQTINRISTRFIVYTQSEEVTDELLRDSAQALDVDKAFVYRFSEDFAKASVSFHWFEPSLPAAQHIAEDFDNSFPTSWFENLLNNQLIAFPGMTPDEEVLAPYLRDRQIQALLILPFFLKGELSGFLGFASINRSHAWRSEELSFGRNIAEILARAVERHAAAIELNHHLQELERANQRLLDLDGLRNNLISGISDEMRSSLQSIIAFMESAENRAAFQFSSAQNGDFEQMLRNNRNLLDLIERMTKVSEQIDSDHDQPTFTAASS